MRSTRRGRPVKTRQIAALVLGAFATATIASSALAESAGGGTWREIPGGPGTMCAAGTPYSFFFREGDPKRLMIFLDGGGACWSPETCVKAPSFDGAVDSTDIPRAGGILDFARAENPVRGFTVVDISSCTGDVYLGSRDVTYPVADSAGAEPRPVVIHHQGAANTGAALNWVFQNVSHPDVVFVLGLSAGGIASPYYAALIAEHYPKARVVQLGESAGGYRTPAVAVISSVWGVSDLLRQKSAYRHVDSTRMTWEYLYTHASRAASRVHFAQVNSVEDATQVRFLALAGVRDVPLRNLLASDLADIRKVDPRFRSFTAPGAKHILLGTPEFYTLQVDGITLRDWVAAHVAGRSVRNVGEGLLAAPPSGSHPPAK